MRYSARCALNISAAFALLAGCGAPPASVAEPGMMPQSRGSSTLAPRGESLVVPQASGDLLYVASYPNSLSVFSYPRAKPVGTISGLKDPAALCVDVAGDIFVVNNGGKDIVEYAHGGSSPIKTLSDAPYVPEHCSSDPVTGDLAAVERKPSSVTGSPFRVAVFKNATGTPVRYTVPPAWYYVLSCGYDDAGNLFVSAVHQGRSDYAGLGELKRGGRSIDNLGILGTDAGAFKTSSPRQVQWDGSHLAVSAQRNNADWIYQFTIASRRATLVNVISLQGGFYMQSTWIEGNTVVAIGNLARVWFFPYPAGGSPTKTFKVAGAQAVAISTAP